MSAVVATAARALATRVLAPILEAAGSLAADAARGVLEDALKSAYRYEGVNVLGEQVATLVVDVVRRALFYQTRGVADAPNPGFLVDYNTLEELLKTTFGATLAAAALVGEDASEVVMEVVQEGITQAIMYGLGGALALTAAYSYGYSPHSVAFQQYEEYMSPRSRSNLDITAGNWSHYLAAVEFMRLAGEYENLLGSPQVSGIYRGLAAATAPATSMLAALGDEFRSVVAAIVGTINEYLAVLSRRVNDVLWALEAAELDYQNGVLTEAEYNLILMALNDQLDAIDTMLERISTVIENFLDNIDTTLIDSARTSMDNAINNLVDMIKQSWWYNKKQEYSEYWDTLRRARSHTRANIDVELEYAGDRATYAWQAQG